MLLHDEYPKFSLSQEGWSPAKLEIDYPADGIARWRPLVQWLLIIPYAIVSGLLGYVAAVVWLVGIFVILFTGKLPLGMFKLILIPNRWNLRTFAYSAFMVDRYPPFELGARALRPLPVSRRWSATRCSPSGSSPSRPT